ncbi:uncharacterized protein N7483_012960 [Penicillium malachiteum]|uniref:uncharacterized protein n=1 Tax=Penicillium malachiteum TaxID=1324776 RepID=UPI002549B7B4|nr:uncharacterized protein N7483_012960 [Penicillium malachiteum]KAJ5715779.1 hypothetical protein N7483_012960 [Penicillium malachiteum]
MDFGNPKHLVAAAQKMRAEFLKAANTVPVSVHQAATLRDDPVIGPFWVSKFSLSIPTDDNSCDALLQLVDEANLLQAQYDRPTSAPLRFEWVGHRSNATKDTPEPPIGEKEKFDNLSAETKGPLTIFYIYGGSFVFSQVNFSISQNTPSCHRKLAANLAKDTGAKVLLVEQR